jgi:hypothetical protein
MITGHHNAYNSSGSLALKKYFKVYAAIPDNALINLCIGTWCRRCPCVKRASGSQISIDDH